MAKKIKKSALFGDYCFREKHMGMSPDVIRAQLDQEARARIATSMSAVRFFNPQWPWLRQLNNAS